MRGLRKELSGGLTKSLECTRVSGGLSITAAGNEPVTMLTSTLARLKLGVLECLTDLEATNVSSRVGHQNTPHKSNFYLNKTRHDSNVEGLT